LLDHEWLDLLLLLLCASLERYPAGPPATAAAVLPHPHTEKELQKSNKQNKDENITT
jgi:hypothetical protein